jgi:hypothetical protein
MTGFARLLCASFTYNCRKEIESHQRNWPPGMCAKALISCGKVTAGALQT